MNPAFGWCWLIVGFLTGAWLGLSFRRPDYLGGYDSLSRCLVRLGHISCLGLGIVNILFGLCEDRIALSPSQMCACAWLFIVGGVSMPVSCFATAVRNRLHPLFAIPVLSLLTASGLTIWGVLRA